MLCNRCGRAQPPDAAGPFCVHCGQFLVASKWVASTPHQEPPAAAAPPTGGYTGPPSYAQTPDWGFPALPWRPQTPADAVATVDPAEQLGPQTAQLVPLLRGLAMLAMLAAAGEVWRYILLLISRSRALSAGAVAASDALVNAASWVSTITSIGVGAYLLLWVIRVRAVAGTRAGVRPSRSTRSMLIGWLVPGLNLTVPGSTLAEVEHTALGRPTGQRPDPSRLLRVWWALWAANVVLGVISVLWYLRSGVQAQADGVELHALVDLVVAATAEVTARMVLWLNALVTPAKPAARQLVVRVTEPAAAS